MAILDFLKFKKKPEAEIPIPSPTGTGQLAVYHGQSVEEIANVMVHGNSTTVSSPQAALKFSEYYNSINKISNTVSTLTCNFYKSDIKLREEEYNQVFLWKKMMSPGITSPKMIKAWSTNYLKGGNGFLICIRNPKLEVMRYVHREWHQMTPFKFEDSVYYYDLTTKEIYNWYNVLHLADIINDELTGVSKVKHYSDQLGRTKAASEFFNKYINSGLFLSGAITYPPGAGVEEKDIPDLQKMMSETYGGVSKSAKMAIITEGGSITQFKTDIPLSDTEWLKSEEVTKQDVRSAFGVPENLGSEGNRTEYFECAVLPVCRQIEAEVNTKVVAIYDQADVRFKFEVESILRADVKTKADVIEKCLRNSIYTINEARALYNLPPIVGGDVPMVMANNMVPLEQLEEFINSKMK